MKAGLPCAAAVLAVAWLTAGAPAAEADREACEALRRAQPDTLGGHPLYGWIEAHRERLATLLTPKDMGRYRAFIDAGRCVDAAAMIVPPFRAAFPEMACLVDPPLVGQSLVGLGVVIALRSRAYPEVGLCIGEKTLADSLDAFAEVGVAPPVTESVRGFDATVRDYGDLWRHAYGIDGAVDVIRMVCESDGYQPACLAYARAAEQGVVETEPDTLIYFLVVRARLAGFDSAERARLEAEVGARLSVAARAEQEERARASLAEAAED